MELIERYLQAVGFWLPKAQKKDILAELSEDIRSQVEEKESELGHPVTDADVEAILKQRGSPIMVANRFLPQRQLIGPVLYPIYRFVIKMTLLFYALPWLIIWLGMTLLIPSYHAQPAGNFITVALHGLWIVLLYTFAAVTFAFAILEKYALKSGFLEKWNPRRLPPLRDPNRIKRSNSIAEIVALLSVSVCWLTFLSSPVMVNRPEVHIVLAPAWRYYFWWIVVLLAVTIAMSCTNLFHPYWTRLRASVRLITDIVGWGMFAWLCKVNIVAEISVHNVSPEKTLHIVNGINLWMGRCAPVVIIMGALVALFDIYRILRVKNPTTYNYGSGSTLIGMNR